MLLWGVFTLGYLLGVGIALWFAWPARPEGEETAGRFELDRNSRNPWQVFRRLTRVNYPQAQ